MKIKTDMWNNKEELIKTIDMLTETLTLIGMINIISIMINTNGFAIATGTLCIITVSLIKISKKKWEKKDEKRN